MQAIDKRFVKFPMHDIDNLVISPEASLQQAVEVIDKAALRIALVSDVDKSLLGTVTDGDIRRALIQHRTMDTPVSEIMNSTPRTAHVNDDRESILALMCEHGLLQIPVIDDESRIVGLETLSDMTNETTYSNAVFIMAGGFGTRLRPMTLQQPKPMLSLGERPLLESIIKNFIHHGFKRFYISVHYLAEQIIEFFGDGSELGVEIRYVRESKPLGTAGALSLLPEEALTHPVIIMNGDILTKVNFEHLLRFHESHEEAIATMCVRKYDFQVPFGVVKSESQLITKITEKPVQKMFVNAGIYVLDPKLIRSIEKEKYVNMPALLQRSIDLSEQVLMFPIHEYWVDIGCVDDFQQAKTDYHEHFIKVE